MRKSLRLVLCLLVSTLFLHSRLVAHLSQIKANPSLKAAVHPLTVPEKNAKISPDLKKTYDNANPPAFRSRALVKTGPKEVLNKDVQVMGDRVIINVTLKESE